MPLLPATLLGAGQVYRTVNPDGSVTFSDTPPPGAASGTAATAAGSRAPASGDAPGATSGQVAITGSNAAPKRATASARAPAPEAQSSTGRSNGALEGAVVGVLGIEDVVLRSEKLCVETLPTSFARYGDAVRRWKTRNGGTVDLARRRLASDFDAPTRTLITRGIPFRNDATFSQVKGAPAAARIKWCDQTFSSIDGGTLDVATNTRLTGPLATP